MKLSPLFSLVLSAVVLASCQTNSPDKRSEPAPGGTGTGTGSGNLNQKISYDGWVKTYLSSNCVSCHGSGAKTDLSTYSKAKSYASAMAQAMKSTVASTMMPPSGARPNAQQIQSMDAWIAQGTPETDPSPNDGGNAGGNDDKVTYENWTKKFIYDECKSCHDGSQEPDLTTFAGVKAAASASLSRMKSKTRPMPPKGEGSITSTQISKFEQWIDDGRKETSSGSANSGGSGSGSNDNITYSNWTRGFLQTNCLSCHSGRNAPNLTTQTLAKSNARKVLESLQEDASTPMPPENAGGHLGQAPIEKWQAWMDGGYK